MDDAKVGPSPTGSAQDHTSGAAGPRAADVLVLFGITGDLAHKLVLPALYRLVERGELAVPADRRGTDRPRHRRAA